MQTLITPLCCFECRVRTDVRRKPRRCVCDTENSLKAHSFPSGDSQHTFPSSDSQHSHTSSVANEFDTWKLYGFSSACSLLILIVLARLVIVYRQLYRIEFRQRHRDRPCYRNMLRHLRLLLLSLRFLLRSTQQYRRQAALVDVAIQVVQELDPQTTATEEPTTPPPTPVMRSSSSSSTTAPNSPESHLRR